ncbi:hypothetical protein CA267_002255 [Alteromonas pelagimontana]|uniref:Bacteriocin n=1 Tax=Alteromonas pelagimontana TaxID=1858656 RepID=A0A6M4MAV2_9ALTE|nr:hypothetical protein [Alteromonas pelagimontana]QJR79705.1 hypothetical protein CA267_002255 [Alteromonas pelagimontana]
MTNQTDLFELTGEEMQLVTGGSALAAGIKGGMTGAGVGGALGTGGALMAAANGARWGMIGGGAGAFVGAAVGLIVYAYY